MHVLRRPVELTANNGHSGLIPNLLLPAHKRSSLLYETDTFQRWLLD